MGDFNNPNDNNNDQVNNQNTDQNQNQQTNPYVQNVPNQTNANQTNPYQQQYNQTPYQQPQYQQPQYDGQSQYQQNGYQQSQYQQNPYQQPYNQYQQPVNKNNGMAIGALVCGILSIILCCIPFLNIVLAIVGIVLGILCIKNKRGNKNLAIVALVLSGIGAAVSIYMIIVTFVLVNDQNFWNAFYEGFEEGYGNNY